MSRPFAHRVTCLWIGAAIVVSTIGNAVTAQDIALELPDGAEINGEEVTDEEIGIQLPAKQNTVELPVDEDLLELLADELSEESVVSDVEVVSEEITTYQLSDLSESEMKEVVIEEYVIEDPDSTVSDSSASNSVDEKDADKTPEWPAKESVEFQDWLGYNSAQGDTTWLAGSDFGMFSIESFPTLELGKNSALMFGTGFHFLNGPVAPDMPPRLFDFQMAYQARKPHSSRTILDLKIGVGVFSDFEGSARKGVRFPGHAVGYYQWNCDFVSVFGIEVLDRDDISVLPVGGILWRPQDDLIYELVFPRPKIRLRLDSGRAMYIGGEIGGGTWAIKRTDFVNENTNDNATYRDLRVTFGMMQFGTDSDGVLELGWAFDRRLEFRSSRGDRNFDSAFILRCHTHF